MKAHQLEHDLTFNDVDSIWKRYKVRVTQSKSKVKQNPRNLLEMWTRYVTYRTPQVADTTVDNQYKNVTNQLVTCPYKKLTQAVEVRDCLLKSYT